MITDQELTLSDAQAVTAAAASTNVVDLGRLFTGNTYRDIGAGEKKAWLVLTVTETFDDSGDDSTVAIKMETDTDEAFGSAVDIWDIVTLAALTPAGTQKIYPLPSANWERYARLYYTPGNGNLSAGKITAQIVLDAPRRRDYAAASLSHAD